MWEESNIAVYKLSIIDIWNVNINKDVDEMEMNYSFFRSIYKTLSS